MQEIANEYINAFPELENEIWGTIEIVTEMSGFISALEYDEKTAYDLLRNGLNSLLGSYAISTYGADYRGLFYANHTVPAIKQSTKVNCGIAAALQASIGNGYLSNTYTDESESADKMTELAGYVGYNENGKYGAQAWQVRNIMNHYKADIYDAVPITIYTIDHVINDMKNSFINGYCPIITLNDTSKLSYYNGNSYKHWVTVVQIDDVHDTIMIADSFNSTVCGGSSSFGGIHLVSYDEFIEAIDVGGDCWLVLDTMYPNWAA